MGKRTYEKGEGRTFFGLKMVGYMPATSLQAVRSPLAYRSTSMLEGRWRRAAACTATSLAASAVFVAPLLWESTVRETPVYETERYNSTHQTRVRKDEASSY